MIDVELSEHMGQRQSAGSAFRREGTCLTRICSCGPPARRAGLPRLAERAGGRDGPRGAVDRRPRGADRGARRHAWVIVGRQGDAPAAAQAAIRALPGRLRVERFAGTSLSASAYEQLCTRLGGTDFAMLLTAQDAVSIECGVARAACAGCLTGVMGRRLAASFGAPQGSFRTRWQRR